MAVGDAAEAAGYPLVPESGEEGRVRWGAREINRTRDFVAQVKGLFPSTVWRTYTPSAAGLSDGGASARWRYITPKLIEWWGRIDSGTVHFAGTPVSLSLPSGLHADLWETQPLPAMFNADLPILARIAGGASVVYISSARVIDGTDWPAGTNMTGVVIKGMIAIQ